MEFLGLATIGQTGSYFSLAAARLGVMACRLGFRGLSGSFARLGADLRDSRREVELLREENEILSEAAAPLIHDAPARERFAFIHARHDRVAVKRLCRILATEPAHYHAWSTAKPGRD